MLLNVKIVNLIQNNKCNNNWLLLKKQNAKIFIYLQCALILLKLSHDIFEINL